MRALGPLWRPDPRLSLLIGGKKYWLRQSHKTLSAIKMQVASQFEFQLCVGANGHYQADGSPDIRREC
jgi:hypothetical protein